MNREELISGGGLLMDGLAHVEKEIHVEEGVHVRAERSWDTLTKDASRLPALRL